MSGDKGPPEEEQSIVIDNGSYKLLAGFGGDDAPRCCIYCLAGKSKDSTDGIYYGDEAYTKRSILDVKCPIQRGVITDWEEMEKIWKHAFYNELRVKSTEDYSIVLTEAALNPKSHREKMAEIMFESFQVPALYITNPAVLSLYASGRTEGLVFDCGEDVSCAVPVTEVSTDSFKCLDATERQDIAGRDVANYLLTKLVTKRETRFIDYYTAREIKERCCYIASDITKENGSYKNKTYQLPDGKTVDLGRECFICPEALFNPYSSPLKLTYGIHKMVERSLARCTQQNEALQKTLYANIVLVGGCTMLPGFSERMRAELSAIAPPGTAVKVIAPPEHKSSSWIGGSIIASISFYNKCSTSKAEYKEYGANAIHHRPS